MPLLLPLDVLLTPSWNSSFINKDPHFHFSLGPTNHVNGLEMAPRLGPVSQPLLRVVTARC